MGKMGQFGAKMLPMFPHPHFRVGKQTNFNKTSNYDNKCNYLESSGPHGG